MNSLPLRLDGAGRILLIKPSALGDVVHTLPVVATLRRRYPNVALDWLVEEEAADLVRGHPAVSEVLVSGRRRWLRQMRSAATLPAALREARAFLRGLRQRRYGAVLDLQGLFKSALYVLAAGAPLRVGLTDGREGATWALTHRVTPPPQPVHAVERYLALAAAVDATEVVRDFTISLAAEDLDTAEAMRRSVASPCVVLHPAARWPTKLWEADRWRAVAAALGAAGIGVLLTGSGADRELANTICAGLRPAPRSLAGQLTLKQLSAVLQGADAMVTVDSGPMHIAAAVGTPIVALFGPTDPARTGPCGPATILRRALPCSPCLERRCRIAEQYRCMRDLTVAEVVGAVQRQLERR